MKVYWWVSSLQCCMQFMPENVLKWKAELFFSQVRTKKMIMCQMGARGWCQIYVWYALSMSIMRFLCRKNCLFSIWYNRQSNLLLLKFRTWLIHLFLSSGVVICAVVQHAPCTWPVVLSADEELIRQWRLSAIRILLQLFFSCEEILTVECLSCSSYWEFNKDLVMRCNCASSPHPRAAELLLMSKLAMLYASISGNIPDMVFSLVAVENL